MEELREIMRAAERHQVEIHQSISQFALGVSMLLGEVFANETLGTSH